MSWLTWLAVFTLLVVAVAAFLSLYGAARWAAATRELFGRLEAGRVTERPTVFDARELAGLPEPVQRYFRTVLRDGQPLVRAARFTQYGSFNASADGDGWKPFRSLQRVVTRRPGFVWNARVEFAPGVAVNVHDAYVAGEGLLRPAVLGLFPLGTVRGRGEIARGELLRFFAEAAWYPTALLPSQGVRWEAIDDKSARATMQDGDLAVTLTFGFNAEGLIETVRTDARGRTVGKRIEQQPWEGRFWNYAMHDNMRVPLEGEAAWITPDGPQPYWRGTIESIHYELAQ